MNLHVGDMVQTDSGKSGRIVFISHPTLFVLFAGKSKNSQIKPYRESQLTLINRPVLTGVSARRAA